MSLLMGLPTVAGASALSVPCETNPRLVVPGAECQVTYQLPNLMTPYLIATNHTDKVDWFPLNSIRSQNPVGEVPGIQIDGYFPDTSTSNTYHQWNHDAQFVIRLPDRWNGKLVVTGAFANRRQYSLDYIFSDWFLARGYAFAATDKGNSGSSFYEDGAVPGDAIAEWNARVRELTLAAKEVVRQRYGQLPAYTYITGIDAGGYLTRYQLEKHPELYDGGVDWVGMLFRAEGPNYLTHLPAALKHYPEFVKTGKQIGSLPHQAMIAAGYEPGSEFLWEQTYGLYWDLNQRIYREEFDPSYDGEAQAGTPFCLSGTSGCDTDYDYQARRAVLSVSTGVSVEEAISRVSVTGKIQRPLLTLHGTLDALLPRRTSSDVYTKLVQNSGRQNLHRYYVVEAGSHVDSLHDEFPLLIRPILPCYRAAFLALEKWVETNGSSAPPASRFIPKPTSGDLANECPL